MIPTDLTPRGFSLIVGDDQNYGVDDFDVGRINISFILDLAMQATKMAIVHLVGSATPNWSPGIQIFVLKQVWAGTFFYWVSFLHRRMTSHLT